MARLQAFIAELRRRRVLRAAVAYGVGAFGLIQGTEVIVSSLEIARGVQTAVVVAALAGFPVAMVLAWLFDIGPEGVERTAPRLVIRRHPSAGAPVAPPGEGPDAGDARAAMGPDAGGSAEPAVPGRGPDAGRRRWWAKP